jgi:phage FluMu protein Com
VSKRRSRREIRCQGQHPDFPGRRCNYLLAKDYFVGQGGYIQRICPRCSYVTVAFRPLFVYPAEQVPEDATAPPLELRTLPPGCTPSGPYNRLASCSRTPLPRLAEAS